LELEPERNWNWNRTGTRKELKRDWNWNQKGIETGLELEPERNWNRTGTHFLTHRGFIDSLCQVVLEVGSGKGD